MKAIIRVEQLLGKSFNSINYDNEKEIMALLYCCVLENNDVRMTLEEFKDIFSVDKHLKSAIRKFEHESKITAQFTHKSEKVSDNEQETGYVSELISALIFEGLDPDYVLNQMELSDIPFMVKAYEKKRKESMEESRLWTFYTILPHIDTKKIKKPSDIITFPWEIEQQEEEDQELIQRNEELFQAFISGKINPLKA